MKIYIDIVMLINMFFDFLILLCTSLILRRNTKIKRLIMGSIVGMISILFLFLDISKLMLFILKNVIAFDMCITAFSYNNFKYTFKNFIYLYFVSIFLGGALYLFNIEISYKNTGIVFFHDGISINIILILIITPIILYFYIKNLKDLKCNYSKYYDVYIYFKSNKYVKLNGYIDTGNNLIDPYKHRLIILVNYASIREYITDEKELIVPYRKLNSDDLLRCIRVKKVLVNNKEYKNILIGLSYESIGIDGVECLLNNRMEDLC